MMRSIYPSPFPEFYAQRRQEDLCNEGKEKSVHTSMYPALCLDVSLHGGIPPGRPPDWKKNKVFSQLWETFTYLAKEGALGEASTVQRILYGFKGEVGNFLKWTFLSPTQPFVLEKEDS